MDQKLFEAAIWKPILENLANFNTIGFSKEDFTAEMKTIDIFPSKPVEENGLLFYVDEQANRFGQALLSCVPFYRIAFNMPNLEVDYQPRTEFENFKTLSDIYEYFESIILNYKEWCVCKTIKK